MNLNVDIKELGEQLESLDSYELGQLLKRPCGCEKSWECHKCNCGWIITPLGEAVLDFVRDNITLKVGR